MRSMNLSGRLAGLYGAISFCTLRLRRCRCALVLLLLGPCLACAQTISFTFDDGLDPRTEPQAKAWNAMLLEALEQAKVQAMFFPAGKIVDSPQGMALVEAWGRAGHRIGNHTYSHASFGSKEMSVDEFTADVMRADGLYRNLPGWTPRLRFPYLKEGDTAAKRDGMRQWMQAHGYLPASVSVDASDWYYSARFVAWQKQHPDGDPAAFRDAYLAHLWGRAQYYDRLARKVTGRSPTHVILLHTNAINAHFLPGVIAMFRAKGWKVVSPVDAYEDPLYSMKPSVLPAGESVVWSLAKQAREPDLRYPAEDDVYEKPLLDALGL